MNALDASALLAFLFREPGHQAVAGLLSGGLVSTVNLSEVLDRFARDGHATAPVLARLRGTGLTMVPFDNDQARRAAELLPLTRPLGLSLGDRACLALGMTHRAAVYTADAAWKKLDLGLSIHVLR
jgi:ribonuclease VapC